MGATKLKAATALMLAVSLVTGAFVMAHQALGPNGAVTVVQENNGPAAAQDTTKSLINGRVIGPDEKPVAGARLYSTHWLEGKRPVLEDFPVSPHGTTGTDGRFALKLPRSEVQPGHCVTLLAAADGFGFDLIELQQKETPGDVILRLVKDVRIRGRLVSPGGKPIAGAKINVNAVSVPNNREEFLKALPRDWQAVNSVLTKTLYGSMTKVLRITASDNDGRFEIAGVGADRWVGIDMIHPAIARSPILIVTHQGLDFKTIAENYAESHRGSHAVYGPSFEHIAEMSRPIEGTVREAGTGRPVAGVTVQADHHTAANRTVTDAQGRYRYLGLPNSPEHTLLFSPPADTVLMGRSRRVTAAGGPSDPIRADVELSRGAIITGRILDRSTRKGVLSRIHFHALPGNQFANSASQELSLVTMTDDEGRFRLVSIPGPGVVAAATTTRYIWGRPNLGNIYKPGKFDAEDRKRVRIIEEPKGSLLFLIAGGVFGLNSYNAYKVVDLKEGEAASYDLSVDPGRTLSVNLEDPEGKPLSGVTVWGETAMGNEGIRLTSATCPVYALDPENPRQLAFLHPKRGLAAALTLRGDEPGPLTVQLKRQGVLTGRALDADGQPMAQASVGVRYASRWGDQLVSALQFRDQLPRADEHGNFRVEGIVPGLKFDLGFVEGRQAHFLPKTWLEVKPLEAGQTLDLGDIRVKSAEPRAEENWRYVVPAPGAAFANPPPRPLVLSERKPTDLKESVSYRGRHQRYGQLIYGTGRPAVVPIVVDEVAPNDVDLYVDVDRKGTITAKDRVHGDNLMWRVRLQAVVPEGVVLRQRPRTVLFRYHMAVHKLSVATCGYWEGQVALDGKTVTVRRIDGDANGLLADPQDRIWVDVNRDGTPDAAGTEFPFAPILRLGQERFAVCADEYGKRLHLAPLQGTGTLQLALPEALKPDQVEEIEVRVQSRDGVMVAMRDPEAAATVPSGDYRITSLRLTLKDPKGGPGWGYIFGDNEGKASRWHRLDTSATLKIDPLGSVEFTATIGDGKREGRAGELLSVSPGLYTCDGLLLERVYRGRFQSALSDSGCAGRVTLAGEGGRILDSARTGFA
jgi:Carboxypeptidase regulatory-like domain